MPIPMSALLGEVNDSIRVHHASGHFTRKTAAARLTANGLTAEQADELLALPVTGADFDSHRTWPRAARTEVVG